MHLLSFEILVLKNRYHHFNVRRSKWREPNLGACYNFNYVSVVIGCYQINIATTLPFGIAGQ